MHAEEHVFHEDLSKRDRLDRFRDAMRRELDLLPEEFFVSNYEEIRRAISEDERRFVDGELLVRRKDVQAGSRVRHIVRKVANQELAKNPLSKRGAALHEELVGAFASIVSNQDANGSSYGHMLNDRCADIIKAHDTLDRLPILINQGNYLLAYKLFSDAEKMFEDAVMSLERLDGYLKEDLADDRRRNDTEELHDKMIRINKLLECGPSKHASSLYDAVAIVAENCRSLFEDILFNAQRSKK